MQPPQPEKVAGSLRGFCFLQVHSARDKAIRFRVCQLITKLLAVEDTVLEDQQFDAIQECMLQRCYDKVPLVRLHAVQASARLQNPTDANCPVIKGSAEMQGCHGGCSVVRGSCSRVGT